MFKKTVLKIILGVISTIAIMALLFYFFLFLNPLGIYESNLLKWIPILITIISFVISGKINKETSFKLWPFLFIPFIIFKLFNYAYFPFILILFSVGILSLVITRKNQNNTYKRIAALGITLLFFYHLFAQPLILEKSNFSLNDSGNIINATTLWDFSKKENSQLPNHLLIDKNGTSINLESLKGKTYFITFWATWCEPCLLEKPDLEKFKETYKNNNEIEFIDISFDVNKEKWKNYLLKNKPFGVQLYSSNLKKTKRTLKIASIPLHFIVKTDGSYKRHSSLFMAKKMLLRHLTNN